MKTTHYANPLNPADTLRTEVAGDRVLIALFVGARAVSVGFAAREARSIAKALESAADEAQANEPRWCPSCHRARIALDVLVCESCRLEDEGRAR